MWNTCPHDAAVTSHEVDMYVLHIVHWQCVVASVAFTCTKRKTERGVGAVLN